MAENLDTHIDSEALSMADMVVQINDAKTDFSLNVIDTTLVKSNKDEINSTTKNQFQANQNLYKKK